MSKIFSIKDLWKLSDSEILTEIQKTATTYNSSEDFIEYLKFLSENKLLKINDRFIFNNPSFYNTYLKYGRNMKLSKFYELMEEDTVKDLDNEESVNGNIEEYIKKTSNLNNNKEKTQNKEENTFSEINKNRIRIIYNDNEKACKEIEKYLQTMQMNILY